MYSQIFNGQSLYHYFCQDIEIMEIIHEKYFEVKDNDEMCSKTKYIPLALLNLDMNGLTALEVAHIYQRPKSFELMIDLLT